MTLVDTGIWQADSVRQIHRALTDCGLGWKDIDRIVVTHMHTDHAGGVSAIQREVDVPIYVHASARFALEGGRPEFERVARFYEQFFHECGAEGKVTRNQKYREENWKRVHYLSDGDTLQAGGRAYAIVHVPGHSQTDICLWDVQTGDAFVGDHLLKDISANAFIEPPSPVEVNRPKALLQYRASMARTRELPFKKIYPGHGTAYVGHQALIDQRIGEQTARCETILQHLQAGKRTIYEISAGMFPWLQGGAVFLGLSEVVGHMDLLLEASKVTFEKQDDVLLFRPT